MSKVSIGRRSLERGCVPVAVAAVVQLPAVQASVPAAVLAVALVAECDLVLQLWQMAVQLWMSHRLSHPGLAHWQVLELSRFVCLCSLALSRLWMSQWLFLRARSR